MTTKKDILTKALEVDEDLRATMAWWAFCMRIEASDNSGDEAA